MIPAAALAVVRAAVEVTVGNDREAAEGMAEQIVEELTGQGWTITLDDPEDARPPAA